MPTNSHPIEQGGAFYIDESGLKNLIDIAKKFTGSDYRLNANFDDNFSHNTTDVDTLIKHPHFRIGKCKSLSISSSSSYRESDRKEIQISLRGGMGQGSIHASISSSNDDIHIVRAELSREIRSFRTKYDILYRIPWILWYIFGGLIGAFLGVKGSDILITASEDQSRQALSNITGTTVSMGILIAFVITNILNKLMIVVFPYFTLAIGKQKEIFIGLQDTRKWAYRALAVAMIGLIVKKFYGN